MIENPGHHSLPIKFTKAITSCGISYEGEIEAIKLGADHTFENNCQDNSRLIYTYSQPAIKTMMARSREPYHNETITEIRDNLLQINSLQACSCGTYQNNRLPSL